MTKIFVKFYSYDRNSEELAMLRDLLMGRGYEPYINDDAALLFQRTSEIEVTIKDFKFTPIGDRKKYSAWTEFRGGGTVHGHYTLDIPPQHHPD